MNLCRSLHEKSRCKKVEKTLHAVGFPCEMEPANLIRSMPDALIARSNFYSSFSRQSSPVGLVPVRRASVCGPRCGGFRGPGSARLHSFARAYLIFVGSYIRGLDAFNTPVRRIIIQIPPRNPAFSKIIRIFDFANTNLTV